MSRNRREPGKDIELAQLRGFARSLAEVELLLLLLVASYVFVAGPQADDRLVVLGALAGFGAAALLLRFLPRPRAKAQLRLALEILAMVAFLTVVLERIGGEASPLLNLYLLPIIAAALVLGRRGTILVTALVSACYFWLALRDGGAGALTPALLTRAAAVLVPFLLVAFLTSLLADNIETAKRRIQALSDRDELTGLLNIRAFMRTAEREHRATAQRDGAYSILMVDVDHLKQINDRHGHASGNKALKTVAQSLLRVTRDGDLVARFGGEEFIACLPDVDIASASETAQRLRNLVYASTFEVNVDIVRIQVSVGVANFPVDGDSLERVMAAAERAMYQDKELRARPAGALVIQKR